MKKKKTEKNKQNNNNNKTNKQTKKLWPFISLFLFLIVIMDCYYGNLDPRSISFHSILLK